MKTGIQVSSFKPMLTTEAEVKTAFEKIAAMGCRYVQLQWIDPQVKITAISSALEASGLRSVSVQDYFTTVNRDGSYYSRLNGITGGTWVCVSRIPERFRSREGLDRYIGLLRSMSGGYQTLEQKLCFHPVSADFTPIDGLDPVEYLLDHMPGLEVCFDLYHLHKSGKDMIAWLKKYAGRVCMVHFKDYRILPDGTESLVPAGRGVIDWAGVVDACLETGVQYAFVEQERWNGDPFRCLEDALNWLDFQL